MEREGMTTKRKRKGHECKGERTDSMREGGIYFVCVCSLVWEREREVIMRRIKVGKSRRLS